MFGQSLAAVAAVGAANEGTAANTSDQVSESLSTPIAGTFDVIVCGGGPAGVAAAISAARAGASVLLLECHGCLGGVWTSGMLSYVIDAGKPGFNQELIARLSQLDPRSGQKSNRTAPWYSYLYDVETMKYVLESLCGDTGVRVQLHTRIVSTIVDDSKRIRGVVSESKSGRQAWRAHAVIDATGDGDVGALAGCDFEIGQGAGESDCPCQPMSLMGVISASPETLTTYDNATKSGVKDLLLKELSRAGIEPSYAKPTLWHIDGPIAAIMLNHEYGVRPDDAAAITEATMSARKELFKIIGALRSLDAWRGARLVTTAEQIGVRDGRRVRGRQTVTVADVVAGAKAANTVCTSEFCVDVHALSKEQNRKAAYGSAGIKAKPFQIPLGALFAADVEHLLLAGRCISGDFFAHASYRVTGNAVAMGEYAGITAALSARDSIAPHKVDYTVVSRAVRTVRGEYAT